MQEQTFSLIKYMTATRMVQQAEYLTLSVAVSFGDCVEDFIDMYVVNREWV